MLNLARNWWVFVLRGALAVLFGIAAFLWPGLTVAAFVLLFGAFAIVDGVFSLVGAIRPAPGESRWVLILFGVLSLIAGIFVLTRPGISAVVMLYVAAFWAIASGVAAIVAAIALRKMISGEWVLALYGVLSIVLGIILLTRPAAGILGFIWAIAAYAIVAGIALVVLGFRLRSWRKEVEGGS